MKDLSQLLYALETGPACDRRKFISKTGKGVIAATVLGSLASEDVHAQQRSSQPAESTINELDPVKLKPLDAASERPDPSVPSPLRPSKRVGYALVGLGNLTLNQLLPAMSKCKYSKPVALVSGDAEKAKKVALQYGIKETSIYNYQNFDNIKDNPDVDVVYIVLPNSMHEEFAIRAAKAGKHVLCEKPMATTVSAAQRMIDACKEANRKLMIAYRIQYEPKNKQIKEWTRSQEFGKVRIINAFNAQNIGDPSQWRLKKALSGGGSLPDIGIYDLNTARYLLGEEPESVMASIFTTPGDPRFKEVEETVMFQLFFPSGAIATNTCSYGVHESRYYHCHTDKGATFGLQNAFAYVGLELEISQVKDKREWKSNLSFGAEKDQFALEIDHMSDCVLNNKTPFTPGEEGLQDHRIMEAIYESARTGQVVKLPKTTAKLDTFRGDAPKEEG